MKEKDLIATAEKLGLFAWFDKNLGLWVVAIDDILVYLTPKDAQDITKKQLNALVARTLLSMLSSDEFDRTIIFH